MIWLLINAPWHEWKVTSTLFIDVITDLWPSPDVDLSNPCYQNKPRDLYFDSRCLCLTLLPTAMPLLCPTFHTLNENRFWLLLLKNIDIVIRTSFNQICSAIIKYCLDGMRAMSLNTYFMTDEDLVVYSKMGVSTMQWDFLSYIKTHTSLKSLWCQHDSPRFQNISSWRHHMEHFPRYWPFVRGIHRSPVVSPHKGQWRDPLMFSLICAWTNAWANKRDAGHLRRHRTHLILTSLWCWPKF